MAQDRRSARALAALLPAGAFGLSVSLASVERGSQPSVRRRPRAKTPGDVAERLHSIRQVGFRGPRAVREGWRAVRGGRPGDPACLVGQRRLANGGWHNGGWGNGGWHNGGGATAGTTAGQRLAQWRLGQRLAQLVNW